MKPDLVKVKVPVLFPRDEAAAMKAMIKSGRFPYVLCVLAPDSLEYLIEVLDWLQDSDHPIEARGKVLLKCFRSLLDNWQALQVQK